MAIIEGDRRQHTPDHAPTPARRVRTEPMPVLIVPAEATNGCTTCCMAGYLHTKMLWYAYDERMVHC
jgi:hypothetical protein